MYTVIYRADLDDAKDKLRDASGRMKDLRPAMKQAGEYMQLEVEDRFREERGPDGTDWAGLAASTEARKRNDKILTESGDLRHSIAYQVTRSSLAQGSPLVYAAIQQLGGETKAHTIKLKRKGALFWPGASHPVDEVEHPGSEIPARPCLGYNRDNVSHIDELMRNTSRTTDVERRRTPPAKPGRALSGCDAGRI